MAGWFNAARWVGGGLYRRPRLVIAAIVLLVIVSAGGGEDWNGSVCDEHPQYQGCR